MDKTEKDNEKEQSQLEPSNDGNCDCNDEECVGCFWTCDSCRSNKCGHKCRIGPEWKYEKWETQRSDK